MRLPLLASALGLLSVLSPGITPSTNALDYIIACIHNEDECIGQNHPLGIEPTYQCADAVKDKVSGATYLQDINWWSFHVDDVDTVFCNNFRSCCQQASSNNRACMTASDSSGYIKC